MPSFHVALSGDFLREDGTPAYPMFDLEPLLSDPEIAVSHVQPDKDFAIPATGMKDVDALILLAPKFGARSLGPDHRLKIIARFGVGYDAVDLEACTGSGVAVTIAPDGVRRPVAVSVLTLLLALAHRLLHKDRLTRMGAPGWNLRSGYMGVGLSGRTFGLLGLGNIGAETARIVAPLDMKLIAHDPFLTPETARDLNVELVGLEDLFRRSDFLSVNVPLTDDTRGIVDAGLLGLMKPTAYLINTARGPIVDQRALYDVLSQGRIAGAGLDVFEDEPVPAGDPLLQLENVILTPHSICFTDECFAGLGAACIRNVLAVKRGEIPNSVVNPDVLKTDFWRARAKH